MRVGLLVWLIVSIFAFSSSALAESLNVMCAKGLINVCKSVAKAFEERTGDKVFLNFSSSGRLAMQIEAGAPADVYILSDRKWGDFLVKKGLLLEKSIKPFATTTLLIVSRKGSSVSALSDLKRVKRIAVGDKFTVIGNRTIQAFKSLNIYKKLKNKFVPAATVNQAAVWVVTGNADAAVIFKPIYLEFRKKLKVVYKIPSTAYSPVYFYVSTVSYSKKKDLVQKFSRFLFSPVSRKILERYGFTPVK
jgi:molybdate transport system substrate-binding protein